MPSFVFLLPDLGEGLVEATVIEWLVAAGDEITRNAPLLEVETAKAAIEVPCPVDGRVVELHAAPGEIVEVGKPLASFAVADQSGIVGTVPSERQPSRSVRLRPPE
jgi:pyruvate/2-oxoglutarate dehydrogenase complex dihydrolipoamide acyltransferase (E2) component